MDTADLARRRPTTCARTFVTHDHGGGQRAPRRVALLHRYPHGAVFRRRAWTTTRQTRSETGRDRFILAKGHAAPALYAALAHAGFFPTRGAAHPAQARHAPAGPSRLATCCPAWRCPPARSARACPSPRALRPACGWTGEPQTRLRRARRRRVRGGPGVGGRHVRRRIRSSDNLVAIVDRNEPADRRRTCDVCDPGGSGREVRRVRLGRAARSDGHDIDALIELVRPHQGRAGRYGPSACASSPAP